MRLAFLLPFLCLSACGDTPSRPFGANPAAYRSLYDRIVERFDLAHRLGYVPCNVKVKKQDKDEVRRLPLDQCYRLGPPRRMKGVRLRYGEFSQFTENATAAPIWSWPGGGAGLEFARDEAALHRIPQLRDDQPVALLVEFVGRRTREPNFFTVDGDHYMVLGERLLAVHPLPTPPVFNPESPFLKAPSTWTDRD